MMPAFLSGRSLMREILQLLQDGEFHSGESIGALLGVSRAPVWKRLQHLEASLGLEIHRVRGRGYSLASPLSLLNSSVISDACDTCGWSVRVLESVDSTNAEAPRLLAGGAVAPLLLPVMFCILFSHRYVLVVMTVLAEIIAVRRGGDLYDLKKASQS